MVTAVEAVTVLVVTVKLALLAPAATVTLAGTVAAPVLLLVSVTTAPPVGAAPLNVTVPCDVFPPTTLVGFTLMAESAVPLPAGVRVRNIRELQLARLVVPQGLGRAEL